MQSKPSQPPNSTSNKSSSRGPSSRGADSRAPAATSSNENSNVNVEQDDAKRIEKRPAKIQRMLSDDNMYHVFGKCLRLFIVSSAIACVCNFPSRCPFLVLSAFLIASIRFLQQSSSVATMWRAFRWFAVSGTRFL